MNITNSNVTNAVICKCGLPAGKFKSGKGNELEQIFWECKTKEKAKRCNFKLLVASNISTTNSETTLSPKPINENNTKTTILPSTNLNNKIEKPKKENNTATTTTTTSVGNSFGSVSNNLPNPNPTLVTNTTTTPSSFSSFGSVNSGSFIKKEKQETENNDTNNDVKMKENTSTIISNKPSGSFASTFGVSITNSIENINLKDEYQSPIVEENSEVIPCPCGGVGIEVETKNKQNKGKIYFKCNICGRFIKWKEEGNIKPKQRYIAFHERILQGGIYPRYWLNDEASPFRRKGALMDRNELLTEIIAVMAEKRGFKVEMAKNYEFLYSYRSLRITKGKYEQLDHWLRVHAAEKIFDADLDVTYDEFWLQIHGIGPEENGWLLGGQYNFLVLESNDKIYFIDRKLLWQYANEVVSKEIVEDPLHARGKLYKVNNNHQRSEHEVSTLVTLQDLKDFSDRLKLKYNSISEEERKVNNIYEPPPIIRDVWEIPQELLERRKYFLDRINVKRPVETLKQPERKTPPFPDDKITNEKMDIDKV